MRSKSMVLVVGVFALIVLVAIPGASQFPSPRMVQDISSLWSPDYGVPPISFVELGGVAYFFTTDGVHGVELWRSDLTESGTWMVKDICPGSCGSGVVMATEILDGILYFFADDGVHGAELWRSDGTGLGTWMVVDIAPGRRGLRCYPQGAVLDDFLLFATDDGVHGCELWRSDGTPEGTSLVLDTVPGPNSYEAGPGGLRRINGSLVAFRNEEGLWRSDGTKSGTYAISSVDVSAQSYGPSVSAAPWVHDGIYYFFGDDGVHGFEPWRSDGTAAGTFLLVDANPSGDSGYGRPFLKFGGAVYFATEGAFGEWSLRRTDGTVAGTELFLPAPGIVGPGLLGTTSTHLYFSAFTGSPGHELWATDGTLPGTGLVREINLGNVSPDYVSFVDNILIFPADDGIHGREMWRSDGTEMGTYLLADTAVGDEWGQTISVLTSLPAKIEDRVLFFALEAPDNNWTPWSSDGTMAGTARVALIDSETSSFWPFYSRWLVDLGTLGRKAVFGVATDGPGSQQLWASDGTSPGTQTVPVVGSPEYLGGGGPFSPLPRAGDRILLQSAEGLLATDGAEAGTELLLAGDTSFSLHQFGDTVLGVIDDQVFQTDGTPGGSRFFPSLEYLSDSAEVGGQLFLAASSAGAGNELWFLEASDGTPKLILDIAPGLDSSSPSLLTAAGVEGDPRAVFFARTDEHGAEPWTSDGTPSGTRLLRDVRVGPEGSKPWTPWGPNGSRMAFLGDRAFFVADDGVCGEELWVTDGTPLGTVPFVDLYPGPIGSSPEGLTVVEGRLYFVAEAPGLGRELWSTDGTTLGTSPVADLNPGEGSSLPEFLTPYDGNLFFTAYAPETGAELRALNLDSGQITLVNDIIPGPDSSSPATLVPGEGLLWFAATDGVHGHELWRLELDGLFVDGFESGDTTRWTQN